MKAIVELTPPLKKVRQPREVTVAELRAEVKQLKRELKMAREGLKDMLKTMRQMEHETLWMMDHCEFRTCTCTPSRADFLRTIARDDPGF
jgi:hypothetical protein